MFYVKKKSDALHKKWVDSKNKKCLVIQGARQTGKTYIVERFAEENIVMAMSVFDDGKCKSIR